MDLLAPILRRSVAVVSVVRGEYVAYIYGKDRRRHGRRAREPDLKALWKPILDGHGSEARSGCTPVRTVSYTHLTLPTKRIV